MNLKSDSCFKLQLKFSGNVVRTATLCLLSITIFSCNNSVHTLSETDSSKQIIETLQPEQKTVFITHTFTGDIEINPEQKFIITSPASGRIDKLFVNYKFQFVHAGDKIMELYSPDIITEEQNLLYLISNSENNTKMIDASKQKLKWLGVTDDQLNKIMASKQILNPLPVLSKYSGFIINADDGKDELNNETTLQIKQNLYVEKGESLFAVCNTSEVWGIVNIPQQMASGIHVGDLVEVTSESNSSDTIHTTINYLEPTTDDAASTVRARINIPNTSEHPLKLGSIISVTIKSDSVNGIWIPKSAVVYTGKNQWVYVKKGTTFFATTINCGAETETLLQIISGVGTADSVATNPQHFSDSESFIKNQSHEN